MRGEKSLKILLLGLFVFLQVYLIFIKDYRVLDYSRYANDFPQPLFGENKISEKISQSFRTPGPLSRIDIMLANYKVKPEGGAFQLGIFKGKQCLSLKRYPANTVEDNQFYTFAVDRGKVPPGTYTLELRHFPGNEKERLAVWTFKKDIYPYGNLFVNGKPQEGDMTFRVYYRSTLWQQRDRLIEKIPSLWLSRVLLIVGFLLIILMVNFLFYFFIKKCLRRPTF